MIEFIKQQKAGVISGIIASAFFIYFIQPILDTLVKIFFSFSNYIGSTYIDSIYKKAAHLETYDYSFIFPSAMAGAFSLIFIVSSILMLASVFIPKRKNDENSKDTNKDKIKKLNKDFPKSFSFISGILFLIFGIYGASDVVSNYVQLNTVSSFKQHLRVVSPYISETEEEIIISKWSLMTSQSDYQLIYSELEAIALQNKVKLPENQLY